VTIREHGGRWTFAPLERYHPRTRDASTLARSGRSPSPIRGALVAGFTVVFGLWALSGYELVRRLHDVEGRTAVEHQAALRGERVLSTVRTNVLLGSIYLRDALIDNGPVNREYYREELNGIRGEVERVLPGYIVEVKSVDERRHWTELQSELQEYWKSRELVFAPNAPLNTSEAAAVLRRRVVPSRETILQIVDRITDLQALSQRRHDAEVSELYAELQRRILLIGAVAIIVGIGVAGFATRHVGVLEDAIEMQRSGERQTRQDLERLSARLVTVQEEERRSLARELHDEVGQALTAIKIDIAVAARGAAAGSRERSALDDARTIAEQTLQNVRDLSQLLHPSMLDDFGLPETLAAYLGGFSKRTGIRTELEQQGMHGRLVPEVEVCVYRIVQEALTNVARHSGARRVTVTLTRGPETLRLAVEDDGRGLDPSAVQTAAGGGLGLIGMRERAQALGGTFALLSPRGAGVRVFVQIPVNPAPNPDAAFQEQVTA
jgi:signal transduction histidine kinase